MLHRAKRNAPLRHAFLAAGITGGLLCLLLLGLSLTYRSFAPVLSHGTYRSDREPEQSFVPPLSAPLQTGLTEVSLDISFPRYRPSALLFVPDDCLQSLSVNGVTVADPELPFCDYRVGRTIPLTPLWNDGTNHLRMQIRNDGGTGGIAVKLPPSDPLEIGLWATLLALLAAGSLVIFFAWKKTGRKGAPIFFVLFWGIILQILYVVATPSEVRAHDVGGHLEYIRFIAEHWSIPAPQGGYEFYQPPLYYVLAAPLFSLGKYLSLSPWMTARLLQLLSLSFSVGCLAISWWIARMVFPAKAQDREGTLTSPRVPFLAAVSTLPAFVFFSARINNDVLSGFLSFLTLALLLRWWQRPSRLTWYGVAASIGLGLLTKSTALLFFPVAFVVLLLRRQVTWSRKIRGTVVILLLPLLLAGVILIPRTLEQTKGRAMLIGNVTILTNFVVNTPSTLLTFHPIEVLRHPYNDPFDDRERRDFVWEFFFRSAFFGEFRFGTLRHPLAELILASALLLLPFAGWSIIRDCRRLRQSPAFPLWVTLACLVSGLLINRIVFPYSSSQDFRYTVVLVIPWAFSLVSGWYSDPPFLRRVRRALVGILIGSCALFLLSIGILPVP